MLLSGNRKANQESQKVFPPSSPRCSGPAGPTQNERGKKKMKEKAKVNDRIRIYTEEGDYLIENPYQVTHIDRRFLPKKLYYEAQSLDGLIDIKFLEETEFEKIQ
jgi:hypothetical protein